MADLDLDRYGSGDDPPWLGVDWREHQRWIVAAGTAVNVIDTGPAGGGDAPVLLFVHGHSACWQHWLEQLPAFMATHRCVALDLPGFGRSPLDRPVSMERYARTVDAVCAELGLASVCAVGNSMGGFVVAELALSFPERVERLVLVAAAGMSGKYIGLPTAVIRHPGGVMLGRVLFGLGGLGDGQRRLLSGRARGRTAAIGFVCSRADRLHPALVAELLTGAGRPAAAPAAVDLATYDFRDRVPDIACPTLIVWGDRDLLVPSSCGEEYERAIPDARRVVYAGTGHLPMLERPARFNADLAAFLRSSRGSCARRGRRPTPDARSGLDEPAPDRVADQLDAVAHPELAQEVPAVGLHGLLGEVQDLADLPVGVRLGDQLQDLLLARASAARTGPSTRRSSTRAGSAARRRWSGTARRAAPPGPRRRARCRPPSSARSRRRRPSAPRRGSARRRASRA